MGGGTRAGQQQRSLPANTNISFSYKLQTNLSIEKCSNYLFVNSGVRIVLSNKFSDGCGWSPVRLHLSTLAEFLPLAPVPVYVQ